MSAIRGDTALEHASTTAELARQAALLAVEAWPAAQPVAAVTMRSAGRLLIVGEIAACLGWAERLRNKLDLTVLATGGWGDSEAPTGETYPVLLGRVCRLAGHLGSFVLEWHADGSVAESMRSDVFDLVLDLCARPLIGNVEPPQGYQAPGRDPLDQALAVIELLPLTGEFEKPRYVALRATLCAHSRAKLPGCNNCIDVCATAAITAKGDAVEVDPYLCQGCGTCSSVCPSGALSYQYPRVADLGARIRAMLAAYRGAGGGDACLLFHSANAGRTTIEHLKRRGLPASVLTLETWSADAVGLDLMLSAVALGANRVALLAADSHDPMPLRQQALIAETIVAGLGFPGEHFRVLTVAAPDELEAGLRDWPPAQGVDTAASFCPHSDKRATLDLAVAHLRAQAPTPRQEIVLPAGAPFGAISASAACTLCMACVGACPANALIAGSEAPRLSFVEHHCLQCGLCVGSCPENALSMTPRLLLEGARREQLLRQAEVFRCSACGKPMGARPLIEAMVSRLADHPMFATDAARARLKMCGDCRVVDLVRHEDSLQASELRQ